VRAASQTATLISTKGKDMLSNYYIAASAGVQPDTDTAGVIPASTVYSILFGSHGTIRIENVGAGSLWLTRDGQPAPTVDDPDATVIAPGGHLDLDRTESMIGYDGRRYVWRDPDRQVAIPATGGLTPQDFDTLLCISDTGTTVTVQGY
jgi:hypothetical protein